jgi:hypothetical protein
MSVNIVGAMNSPGTGANGEGSRRYGQVTAAMPEQPEHGSPRSNVESAMEANLIKALELLRDNAYLTYIRLSGADLMKGADWYMQNGKFTRERLEAHQAAAAWLGKHQAYAQVLKLLQSREAA